MSGYDRRIHVENNVILTTKDEITCQQTFNYLSTNLDMFRMNSEFIVVCGVHGAPDGEMLEADEDFRYDYETMFRWFHNEKRYYKCAPKIAKPFQLVEERCYHMGTVVEISSVEDPHNEQKYKLDEKSKLILKTEFERLLVINRPLVLILASCWSHKGEISDILRSAVTSFQAEYWYLTLISVRPNYQTKLKILEGILKISVHICISFTKPKYFVSQNVSNFIILA